MQGLRVSKPDIKERGVEDVCHSSEYCIFALYQCKKRKGVAFIKCLICVADTLGVRLPPLAQTVVCALPILW